jgi:Glyoxalase/Bleomycin resistance protein/Dioxygenase superfamily
MCWLGSRPMREPVFNETLQLGIVVRDLEATMRRYVDDYEIGPWEVYAFKCRQRGGFPRIRPAERSWRLAVSTVGRVRWELIESLQRTRCTPRPTGRSLNARCRFEAERKPAAARSDAAVQPTKGARSRRRDAAAECFPGRLEVDLRGRAALRKQLGRCRSSHIVSP